MTWACMTANGTIYIYKDILSAHIQPKASKLTGWPFTVQIYNDPKGTSKTTNFSKAKKIEYFLRANTVT